jgi:hypothetical protein
VHGPLIAAAEEAVSSQVVWSSAHSKELSHTHILTSQVHLIHITSSRAVLVFAKEVAAP